MRRIVIAASISAVTAIAMLLPPGAIAGKPAGPTITALSFYSAGSSGDNCGIYATVTYSGKAKASYTFDWWLGNYDSGTGYVASPSWRIGVSPFTTPTYWFASNMLPPSTETNARFDAVIRSPHAVVAVRLSSTYTFNGCPAASTTTPFATYP